MMDKDKKANILEVFSSVQGEGLCVGERQIFIRFHGCNLKCAFCDLDKSAKPVDTDIEKVLREIDKLNADHIHNKVAITGGEPLLHYIFLESLLPELADKGYKVYLETNGTLASELNRVIGYIDMIAVDIKLPSVSQDRPCWQEHSQFLKAAFKKEFFVKIVVSRRLDIADFDRAVMLMKDISFDIPFVIQPQTEPGSTRLDIDPEELLKLQERALNSLNRVLIIPQVHKMLGVR